MSLMNTRTEYGSVLKFIHWLLFFLVLILIFIGLGLDYGLFPKLIKGFTVNLHKVMGLTVLLIVIFTFFWKSFNPKPQLTARWFYRLLARSMHFILYLTLILMALTGWIMATAAGKLPNFFGILIPFPGIPTDQTLSELAFEVHQYLAWILIGLIIIHVAAALKHFYINKDRVLQRMMPKRTSSDRDVVE